MVGRSESIDARSDPPRRIVASRANRKVLVVVGLAVSALILGGALLAFVAFSSNRAGDDTEQKRSINNLHQIALALLNIESEEQSFPPASLKT
jgi:hypothetical protein